MSDQPADINSREGLAQMIEGRSDEEINTALGELGVETVLDQVFDGMKEAFQPDKAAGQSAVIQWDIAAPDATHSYQVKVADGSCTIAKGADEPARVTLGLSLPNFLRFISGKLDGMQAFMSGQLKLSGDMMFAQTIQNWFAT